jgi:hypothetical protein
MNRKNIYFYRRYCPHSWEEKILRVKENHKATLYCCSMCGSKMLKTEPITEKDLEKKHELELYHKYFGSAMKKNSPKKLKERKREQELIHSI